MGGEGATCNNAVSLDVYIIIKRNRCLWRKERKTGREIRRGGGVGGRHIHLFIVNHHEDDDTEVNERRVLR